MRAEIVYMETKDRLVQKAHDLFMRYGIRSVSMDEIATHLGISKKTIYQFFTDKDELVAAVVDVEIHKNEADCRNHHLLSENPVHEFWLGEEMVEELLRMMNPTLIYDMQKYHPAAFRRFSEHKENFLSELINKNLQQGIAEGYYRPEINIPIVTKYRLASIFLLFNPDMFVLGKLQLIDVIREVTLLFLHGITTPKGQKLILKYNQQREKNKQYADKGK